MNINTKLFNKNYNILAIKIKETIYNTYNSIIVLKNITLITKDEEEYKIYCNFKNYILNEYESSSVYPLEQPEESQEEILYEYNK